MHSSAGSLHPSSRRALRTPAAHAAPPAGSARHEQSCSGCIGRDEEHSAAKHTLADIQWAQGSRVCISLPPQGTHNHTRVQLGPETHLELHYVEQGAKGGVHLPHSLAQRVLQGMARWQGKNFMQRTITAYQIPNNYRLERNYTAIQL